MSGQSGLRDTCWERIAFICDSLKYAPAAEINLLLKLEDQKNQFPVAQDSAYVYLLRQIGLLYFNQGEFLKSVKYNNKSIEVIQKNIDNPHINPDHLIISYFRLNTCYDSLGMVSEKVEMIDSCISIAERRKINNLYSLAAIYKKVEHLFNVGDYDACIDYAALCERMGKKYAQTGDKNNYSTGMQYVSSSLVWNVYAQIMLKRYDLAENMLKKSLSESKKAGLDFNQMSIHEQLAEIQISDKNFTQALAELKTAFNIAYRKDMIVSCKPIMNNMGNVYLRNRRNLDSALFYFSKANSLRNKDNKPDNLNSIETLNILGNISSVYTEKGMYDSASVYFQLALDQIKPGLREEELLSSRYDEFANQNKIGYLTGLLLDRGEALIKQYEETHNRDVLRNAIRIYKVTDQLLDRIKNEQSDIQSKLFWRTDTRRLYERGIEACFDDGNNSDAFYFFEKSRAVLLNEQLNDQRWIGEDDIIKQNQLKRNIAQLTQTSNNLNKDSEPYLELQNDLLVQKQELTQLIQVIRERDPLYYQSYIDSGMVTIQDVQRTLLNDHQGLIEMFAGDSAIYVFSIQPHRVDFKKLNKNIFDSLSRQYISVISDPIWLNKHFPDFIQLSRHLYRQIFENLHLTSGRLIMSFDGQYFPIEGLDISNPGETTKYLFNDFAVSYTYSAKYLMNDFISRPNSDGHIFLGVAPIRYPDRMKLNPLIGSDQSLSILQSNFKESRSMISELATRNEFLNQYSGYKIIQLYTHATDSGVNGEPQIYFADSALNLSDLTGDAKPVTQLVVLSACETGKGRLYQGEGIFSFNRAFAALGVPSSVVNLWSVDDQSTYRLNELFYFYLAKEFPIDVALQKAKIDFYRTASMQNQLPYYWAASVLVGKNNRIEFPQKRAWKTNAVLFTTILLIIFLIFLFTAYHGNRISNLKI